MAERKHPVTTASRKRGSDRTRRFPHLKPLSDYSHMVFCKATNSCSVSPSWSPDGPSWNLKVELSNSRASVGRKRRLDDSCLDETYDTPPKKPCFAPDSAWDLDSSNTFRLVKLVSTQSSSVEEIKRIEKTLSGQKPLGLDWIHGSDKTDGESSTSLTAVHSSSLLIVHSEDGADVSLFDYDMGEIMCLSPIDSVDVSADGLENFLQSCETYDEEQLQVKKGHDSWRGSKRKQGPAVHSLGKDSQTGSDEGYVTKLNCTADPGESEVTTESEFSKCEQICFIKSYKITVPNLSNDKTSPVFVPNMSTPLAKSPNLDLDKESCNNWEPVKTSSTSSPSACVNLDAGNTEALPTIPFLNVNESKEGNVVLEGTSIHKSLVCHVQVKHAVTQGKEEEDVLSVSQRQADAKIRQFGKEAVASDSVERALPLRVQVKPRVVLPNTQLPEAVKATARQQPEKKAASESRTKNVFKDVPRPVFLYREEDWEKEKKAYVDLVMSDMADNTEGGVMTELLHLMNAVANQGRRSDGRKWQHPSDLTRRNYRLRNSGHLLSLDEWQNLNYRNHRRFAKVPQMFKRSPVL